MVRLVPMIEAEFLAYLEEDIERYAQERVQVGDWHASEALQKSREEHQQLLPDGVATTDCSISNVAASSRKRCVSRTFCAPECDISF